MIKNHEKVLKGFFADETSLKTFEELRDTGLLWLINTAVLHPRGCAMELVYNEDMSELKGWKLVGSVENEPWYFEPDDEIDKKYQAINKLIKSVWGAA